MNYKSPLQDRFAKLYPESRSFWRQAPPTSIDKLYALQLNCLQAYFKLDKLSSIMESEKWGNAMLDSLLLIEQTSAADNLVKEFEREIAVLEKIAAAKKQQATDKTTKDNN